MGYRLVCYAELDPLRIKQIFTHAGFDFIGVHGIWSWISDENRSIMVGRFQQLFLMALQAI